jgi:hypothetical protein
MKSYGLLPLALLATLQLATLGNVQAGEPDQRSMQAYNELLEMSLKEKKGLMFYVNGQAIGGAVTRIGDDGFIEVRNQQYGRILIRLEQVDALAAN